MVERSGSAREVRQKPAGCVWLGVWFICVSRVADMAGNDGAAGGTAPPEMTMRQGDHFVGSSNA
ncbi:hypothetical protein ACQ6H3_004737 [Citrobacter freundii]